MRHTHIMCRHSFSSCLTSIFLIFCLLFLSVLIQLHYLGTERNQVYFSSSNRLSTSDWNFLYPKQFTSKDSINLFCNFISDVRGKKFCFHCSCSWQQQGASPGSENYPFVFTEPIHEYMISPPLKGFQRKRKPLSSS